MVSTDGSDWIDEALGIQPTVGEVYVAGVPVATRTWATANTAPGAPAVVLIHGGGAHSRWWDHLAPRFVRHGAVLALDLSGHGDSGRRSAYDVFQWADEVAAAARAEHAGARPVLVGTSLGGLVALAAAQKHEVAGVITIDSVLLPLGAPAEVPPVTTTRTYDTFEAAVQRFRTLPEPTPTDHRLHRHIATHSVRRTGDRWGWKFDPKLFACRRLSTPDLREVGHPTLILAAERGYSHPVGDQSALEALGPRATRQIIPGSGHHATLERPQHVANRIDRALKDWTTTTS